MKLADLLTTDAVSDARFSALELAGISTDSRTVKPGDLFVAVAGAKDDGLRFVGGALASGAAAIMAERVPPMPLPDGVAFIKVGDARRALALGAAKFFPRQPEVIAAITGTSGKTSVAAFTRQIWAALGKQAASIGTVGLVSPTREVYGSLTTPDPVALHRSLDELAGEGVTHLAMEASSHGLDQRRLDGVRVAAGAFTNLSRDHLDYHPTLEDYLAAKLRLFTDLIVPGGAAVIAADHEHADAVVGGGEAAAAAPPHRRPARRRHPPRRDRRPKASHRCSSSRMPASDYTVRLPLPGAFQVENALVAAGLALRDRQRARRHLRGARAAQRRQGPARTGRREQRRADLRRLCPQARCAREGARGAAAVRDAAPRRGVRLRRRPRRRQAADDGRDRRAAWPTGSSSPTTIRAARIRRRSAPRSCRRRPARSRSATGARRSRRSIADLRRGDVLLIAGKGHETGQIIGKQVLPFSDHEAVAAALAGRVA